MIGARRFQPSISVRSGARWRLRGSMIAPMSTSMLSTAILIAASSSAISTALRPGCITRFHRRVEVDAARRVADADQRCRVVGHQRVAKGVAAERRLLQRVNLAAGEIEQFAVDRRQAGLPRGVDDDPRDQVVGEHGLDLAAADDLGQLGGLCRLELGGDAVGRGPAVGTVHQSEDRLQHAAVGVIGVGRKHDDRARGFRRDQRQVVEIGRIARAADDPRLAGLHLGRDLVFHLDLVAIGEDDDARALAARVGDHQLADHVEDRRRPVEDHGVIRLDDAAPALAQVGELAFDAGGKNADQRRDDEDAADGDQQHDDAEAPAGVGAHGAGVEGPHQRGPEGFEEIEGLSAVRGDPEQRDDNRGENDDDEGNERQPPDQGNRAGRHRLVELVAKTGAEIAAFCHCPQLAVCRGWRSQRLVTQGSGIRKAARAPPCGVLRNFAATETPDFSGRLPQLTSVESFGLLGFIGKGAAIAALSVLAACSSAGGFNQLAGATVAKSSFAPEAPKAAQLAAMEAVAAPQPAGSHNGLDGLISHYAAVNNVPASLIHRVIDRESDYNPKARNGSYYGLMQISHATAKSMGYTGSAAGLLDPEVNLKYATKYLAGAYIVGGGSEDQAIRGYSRGYYYDAKAKGLLEEVGLR